MDDFTPPTLNLGSTAHYEVWRENLDGSNPRLVHVWMEPGKVDAVVAEYNGEEAASAEEAGTPVERRYFPVEVTASRTRSED